MDNTIHEENVGIHVWNEFFRSIYGIIDRYAEALSSSDRQELHGVLIQLTRTTETLSYVLEVMNREPNPLLELDFNRLRSLSENLLSMKTFITSEHRFSRASFASSMGPREVVYTGSCGKPKFDIDMD